MSTSRHPTQEEMTALIQDQLQACPPEIRTAFLPHLIDLKPKILKWEYGKSEEFPAWIFADMGERNVYVSYCTGGHGARGYPWGLVFLDDDYFGMDSGWFSSLHGLLLDWGFGSDL